MLGKNGEGIEEGIGDTFSEGSVRGRHEGDPEGDKVESVVVWCVQIDALILLHEKVAFFPSHRKRVYFNNISKTNTIINYTMKISG